ncbi:unnamed protein product, partial [Arabidopsis halleri]
MLGIIFYTENFLFLTRDFLCKLRPRLAFVAFVLHNIL